MNLILMSMLLTPEKAPKAKKNRKLFKTLLHSPIKNIALTLKSKLTQYKNIY